MVEKKTVYINKIAEELTESIRRRLINLEIDLEYFEHDKHKDSIELNAIADSMDIAKTRIDPENVDRETYENLRQFCIGKCISDLKEALKTSVQKTGGDPYGEEETNPTVRN